MTSNDNPNQRSLLLNNGATMPALGFGTLLTERGETQNATRAAVEVGFRHLDCAERYRNEEQVGAVLKGVLADRVVRRDELFVTTKLWNNHHRPEHVKPALQTSLQKLGLDSVDLYLMHTPFAFAPGEKHEPRNARGAVIYDDGVTLEETWASMEALVDEGLCKAIGLSDINVETTQKVIDSARILPAAVQVESHPYHPQWELHELCHSIGAVLVAFAALGHALEPRLLDDPLIVGIAQNLGKTPAQVLLAWGVQRGTAVLTSSITPGRIRENFDVTSLPEASVQQISERLQSRFRFNSVVDGGEPGFVEVLQ